MTGRIDNFIRDEKCGLVRLLDSAVFIGGKKIFDANSDGRYIAKKYDDRKLAALSSNIWRYRFIRVAVPRCILCSQLMVKGKERKTKYVRAREREVRRAARERARENHLLCVTGGQPN